MIDSDDPEGLRIASPGDAEERAVASLPTHPKGTLAILLVYALLFAAGWLAFYFLLFLGRGAPSH